MHLFPKGPPRVRGKSGGGGGPAADVAPARISFLLALGDLHKVTCHQTPLPEPHTFGGKKENLEKSLTSKASFQLFGLSRVVATGLCAASKHCPGLEILIWAPGKGSPPAPPLALSELGFAFWSGWVWDARTVEPEETSETVGKTARSLGSGCAAPPTELHLIISPTHPPPPPEGEWRRVGRRAWGSFRKQRQ